MTLPYPPPFQDLRTLAQHVSMSEDTIEREIKAGRFPGVQVEHKTGSCDDD